MNKEQNTDNSQSQQLNIAGVIPRLFYVVERNDEDTWEQISIGLKTYKEALEFKNTEYHRKKYPYAFIVASF